MTPCCYAKERRLPFHSPGCGDSSPQLEIGCCPVCGGKRGFITDDDHVAERVRKMLPTAIAECMECHSAVLVRINSKGEPVRADGTPMQPKAVLP